MSQKTRTDYGEILHQTVSDLAHLDKHLDSIASLKQRHVVALVRYWGEQEHAEGTIQWRVSTLRRFLTLIGRDRVIPKGQEWRETLKKEGVEAGTTGRSYLPEMKKGWIDCGIDAERKIAEIRQADPVAACLVELMWAFGLRFNEALQFMPRASEKEGFINVTRGTKGGKHREVPFSTINPQRREFQLRVLETAKQVADRHPKGVVAVRGLTLAQSTNRLRYILRKHGICKDGLGVVPHGMRHQFGTDLFRELTGLPAPVLEELPKEVYTENADLVYSALLEISRQMGHERPSISRAYLSSPQKMERVANKRLAGWLARLGTCRDDFARAGVLEAWVVGKGSFGLPLAAGAALQVAARQKVVDSDSLRALEVLGSRLGEAAGLRVVVSPWMDKSRPDEGAEILFNQSPAA